MQQVTYTSNPHGKLLLHFFQDVRLRDDEKYYAGNVLEIVLNSKVIGTAKVAAVKVFKYSRLTETFSFMNCGKPPAYQADLLRRYYIHELNIQPDTELVQVVFEWDQRNMEQQEQLVKDWWQKIVDAQPNHLNQEHDRL